jgi:RNA polymerase sigma-70 factor (ECF subfamily)
MFARGQLSGLCPPPQHSVVFEIGGQFRKAHPVWRDLITTWEIVADSSDRADYNGGRMTPSASPEPLSGERNFATTRWSIVVAAGAPDAPDGHAALATLCQTYWYPVYAFIRRRGASAADAQDLTQEFFAVLLEKDYVRLADRERGRFRTFLLTAVTRFLAKQRERDHAAKRGGGRTTLSLDLEHGEERYQLEPVEHWTPERLFERRWALTLLDRVIAQLSERYAEQGKRELFERLKGALTGVGSADENAELALQLGLSEGALKVAVHRLRRRYRDLLKQEIAETVADPDETADELDYLLSALRGST